MSEIGERYIALDTETTGLTIEDGHRIIQIACVEMIDRQMTGNDYCQLIDPERKSDTEALRVHRITPEDLIGQPKFADVWERLKAYLMRTTVIIHNAEFDLAFLDAELKRLGCRPFVEEVQCEVIDTLKIARERYPGSSNNLDALCNRYDISLAERDEAHRADVDAKLLASVYLALTSGQEDLDLSTAASRLGANADWGGLPTLVRRADDDEIRAHEAFLDLLNKSSDGACVWQR